MADEAETVTAAAPAETGGVLDRILLQGRMVRDETQRAYARDLIGEFVNEVLAEGTTVSSDVVAAINDRIADIDDLISTQLNEVLHYPDFQRLEASWRGLNYLVMNSETGTMLKLRVLNISKADLLKDLERAVEFDQSALFKKVYEEEYGTFGGFPYSCLVADFEFGRHPQDILLLRKMSGVAASSHAPFIAAANPRLFDMERFTELSAPRDLSKIFESAELITWRSFRESEDSRYVVLALPRVLLRLPYGPDTKSVEGMSFVEDVDGTNHDKYLWGNPAYILGQRITTAFSLYGWTAAIRGVEGGGKVEGLPTHTFHTDEGDIALKCPTEIAITDRREKELNDLGFITLIHCKNTDYAAFFGGQTTNKAKFYNTASANSNAQLSAMLPYILNASRFAHYIKVMMRDKIGSFMTKENVQVFLNTWINDYILGKDDAGQSLKARYPLREARIDISDIPGRPGCYNATVFLRPHFQLEELTASIRLVAELPAAAA
ncbi:MAG TPA: type VI secretion system contractile sheath large subunit [Stellaceae bacterium]